MTRFDEWGLQVFYMVLYLAPADENPLIEGGRRGRTATAGIYPSPLPPSHKQGKYAGLGSRLVLLQHSPHSSPWCPTFLVVEVLISVRQPPRSVRCLGQSTVTRSWLLRVEKGKLIRCGMRGTLQVGAPLALQASEVSSTLHPWLYQLSIPRNPGDLGDNKC